MKRRRRGGGGEEDKKREEDEEEVKVKAQFFSLYLFRHGSLSVLSYTASTDKDDVRVQLPNVSLGKQAGMKD